MSYKMNRMVVCLFFNIVFIPLLVTAIPFTGKDVCYTKTEDNPSRNYVEYGSAILNAITGDPVDLVLLGTDYLTRCLLQSYPKSQFLKTLDTGLQCVKKAYDAFSGFNRIKSWFRRKRSISMISIHPSYHKGKLNITAIAGEYLLLSLNLEKEIPRERIETMTRDPRILPCQFNEYDTDGNGEISREEFDTSLLREGFWTDDLLFRILSQGGDGPIHPDTFNKIAPSLHQYMKFEKCSDIISRP